jgi:hypothetical protein
MTVKSRGHANKPPLTRCSTPAPEARTLPVDRTASSQAQAKTMNAGGGVPSKASHQRPLDRLRAFLLPKLSKSLLSGGR